MIEKTLWDFRNAAGRNLIRQWAEQVGLTSRERAHLNQRLDRLAQLDFRLAVHSDLVNGPLKRAAHVYKMRVFGDRAIRLLLCRGPHADEMETAFTLLVGAIEKSWKYHPANAEELAGLRRDELLAASRQSARVNHVRF